MLYLSDLDLADPLKRDLAYLLLLEELLGPDWVKRWARERGKLEALREWQTQTAIGTGGSPRSQELSESPQSASSMA